MADIENKIQIQTTKKKVLILSLYYPPCNITAAQRVYSWAKYLNEHNIYPIVVTRRWDYPIKEQLDAYRETPPDIIHEQYLDYEVYYLPYKANLRDKILVKYGDKRFKLIRRLLTLIEIISLNFTNFFLPYKNLYNFTYKYLKNNIDIKILITTAYPFSMFRFAYMLKKKLQHIEWIGDYRDLWTTRPDDLFIPKNTFWGKIRAWLEPISEKKWLSNAYAFTSISQKYVDIIGKFINKKGYPILNGYIEEDFQIKIPEPDKNVFLITFLGTLKAMQKVEVFLDAFEKALYYFKDKITIKIRFIGTAYEETAAQRLYNYTKKYSQYVEITKRIHREEAIKKQIESQLLLLVSYSGGTGGGTGSKMYEYIGTGKPMFLCPSDKAMMEEIIKTTGQGFFCNTTDEAYELLVKLIEEFYQTGHISMPNYNDEVRKYYSRRTQTKLLADLINHI
ncbi:MAG TPA: glycosyltransferase [Bacteroidales bacterium]|nr:glycosyltransferase [Bacteroidales bacterium]